MRLGAFRSGRLLPLPRASATGTMKRRSSRVIFSKDSHRAVRIQICLPLKPYACEINAQVKASLVLSSDCAERGFVPESPP